MTEKQRIARLAEAYRAAPMRSKRRRHLRRAYDRAVARVLELQRAHVNEEKRP